MIINTQASTPAPRSQSASANAPSAPEHVDPMDTFPMEDDSLTHGDGWAGINKPIKVKNAAGEVYVAKSNTLGAFAGLHPNHSARTENVHEIVSSHIMADEFHLPTLTFQEGYLVAGDQKIEKVLSKFQTDFQTLEHASVKDIKNPEEAVKQTIVQGWLGDWDSTFNDSNVWVKNDGTFMGSDYGYAAVSGVECCGIPYANMKVMKKFATKENVTAIVDQLKSQSDEQIHDMVNRVGGKWIHDWSPEMEKDISGALIANRDALRKRNPYLKYVQGFHPILKSGLVKMKYPRFFYKASKAQFPPLSRPDQILDVFGGVTAYFKMNKLHWVISKLREHVHGPDDKPNPEAPKA